MADQNVKKAQTYLNAMFSGNPNWVHLDEDGITGTTTMQGIVRAFQIQNNVSGVNGSIGPATIKKMKTLNAIRKMDLDDKPLVNVCLIQCALFCKGYAAGGITGIYYNSGVAAVKKMQGHAGLPVTGEIGWKVWAGLLSLNWFTKVSGGSDIVRKIQQQLNSDWSDVIGVGPCDGIVSRQTALSLVGALQAAEGVTTNLITNLNSVNFGNATTSAFPRVLKEGQNASYVKYNKLAQYGLYFNGYDPRRYDGIYDSITKSQVAAFQKFYGLNGIGLVTPGEVNVSTMKSLLTSKGDTNRKAKACDCSTILNKKQAKDLKAAGYLYIGRYLTGTVGLEHKPKALTLNEINAIQSAGLSVFPIYQDGGSELDYFKNPTQGCVDATTAIAAAKRVGIPEGTTIYFAVDFDCYGYQIDTFILPYFKQINAAFNGDENDKHYKVGIYAPRYVCSLVYERGYTSTSFVSDMSTGFSCNLGYPIPKNWAFDQFYEMTFSSTPSLGIDKDSYSGRDSGCKEFDPVRELSDAELIKQNRQDQIKIARDRFIFNVLDPIGLYDRLVSIGVKYGKEIYLQTIETGSFVIDVSTELSGTVSSTSEYAHSITVSTDDDGNLSTSFENSIAGISEEMEKAGLDHVSNMFTEKITDIALSMKVGKISYEFSKWTGNSITVKIEVGTNDLLLKKAEVTEEFFVALICKFTIKPDYQLQFSEEAVETVKYAALAGLAVVIALYASPALAPYLTTVFSYIAMAN